MNEELKIMMAKQQKSFLPLPSGRDENEGNRK
jgi:hypothetical protein